MKVYIKTTGWKVFTYVTCSLAIALMCWILLCPLIPGMKDELSGGSYRSLLPVFAAVIFFFGFCIYNAAIYRVVVSPDDISFKRALSDIRLKLDEVSGYRTNERYLFIIPVDRNKDAIVINNYIGDYSGLITWVSSRFPELPPAEEIRDEQGILADERYGPTQEARADKLKKAKRAGVALNAAAFCLFFCLFADALYPYAFLLLTCMPIAITALLRHFNGLLQIDGERSSPFPSVIYAFIFATFGLTFITLDRFHIDEFAELWKVAEIIFAVALTAFILSTRELRLKHMINYRVCAILSVLMFMYALSVSVFFNCMFDTSAPQAFHPAILEKSTINGRSTHYYFHLTTCTDWRNWPTVSVSSEMYDKHKVGDTVDIYLKKGSFNAPWFYVTDHR